MSGYSRTQVPDHVLVMQSKTHAARERGVTAELLADLAEIDARGLFRDAACSSMFRWCVRDLHFSEDAAYKRMQAARSARRHPVLFEAIADGRLHLTAVVLLAPHITSQNVEELIAAATHLSKANIELLLAERFPRPDLPAVVRTIESATSACPALALAPVDAPSTAPASGPTPEEFALREATDVASATQHPASITQLVPEPVLSAEPLRVAPASPALPAPHPAHRAKPEPLSTGRYGLQFTIGQQTYEDLQTVQNLLAGSRSGNDVVTVFAQAIQLLRRDLERRRWGATTRPRRSTPPRSTDPRAVPARVRQAVWRRDKARCTFTDAGGQRCDQKANLELDHVIPVARGGESTLGNLRLRCRAHNQLDAERLFGRAFMETKRKMARTH